MKKSKKIVPSKIIVTHPSTGTERKLDKTTYDLFKSAIIQTLKGSTGKTLTELANDVKQIIRKKSPGFKGSASWYTISVRLDLETRGIVETFSEKRKKFQRLKK
ncbi:MAG TPA: hypothetical protein VK588_05795 [Chitinophagaceae bacterium]|nr:hypothetical protein [Chitinophagaceae bacterium]